MDPPNAAPPIFKGVYTLAKIVHWGLKYPECLLKLNRINPKHFYLRYFYLWYLLKSSAPSSKSSIFPKACSVGSSSHQGLCTGYSFGLNWPPPPFSSCQWNPFFKPQIKHHLFGEEPLWRAPYIRSQLLPS